MASPSATSVWLSTAQVPSYSPLTSDTSADVCVVGGGIAGLTVAYLLAQVGKSVVVVENGAIGSGMTGVTTAHLVNALDDRYFELERLHGARGSRLAAESHTAAIARAVRIAKTEDIDCDLVRLDGWLFAAPDASLNLLDRELVAAHRAGLTGIEMFPRAPLQF